MARFNSMDLTEKKKNDERSKTAYVLTNCFIMVSDLIHPYKCIINSYSADVAAISNALKPLFLKQLLYIDSVIH